jgi:hypothetical protein
VQVHGPPKRTAAGTYSALTTHGVLAAVSGLVALTLAPANVGNTFTVVVTGKLNAALDAIFPSERGLASKAEFLALLGKVFILEVQPLRTRVPPAQELETPTRQASEGPATAPPGGGAPGSMVAEGQAEDSAAGASNHFPTLDSQRGAGTLSRKFTLGEVTPAAFASLSQKIKESLFTAILNVAAWTMRRPPRRTPWSCGCHVATVVRGSSVFTASLPCVSLSL